jgi:RteC protein
MKQEYQLLHRDMLQDIERCMQLELSERELAESCFWIANEYWRKLKNLVREVGFKNESEEIDFFRNVKVDFTSYIEYYTLLTGGLSGEPATGDVLIHHWTEESLKSTRFYKKNEDFIKYYESGQQFNDGFYFTKADGGRKPIARLMPYDNDLSFCSTHDHLVRGLLAHKMYYEFTRKRIDELNGKEII